MPKRVGRGDPTRLFVGGLHGDEYGATEPYLQELSERFSVDDIDGGLVLANVVEDGEYVSTLEERYYGTKAGRRLLSLIKRYEPSIYVELHSYDENKVDRLTDDDRTRKRGVPPLTDLGSGVLAGSVSPLLRRHFDREDFCFLLDLPKGHEPHMEAVLEVLDWIATGCGADEIIFRLLEEYPAETEEMVGNYLEFYRDSRERGGPTPP